MDLQKRDYISKAFYLGMWWRILYGFSKFILGFILLFFIHTSLGDVFYNVFGSELAEDPSDLLLKIPKLLIDKNHFDISFFLAFYFMFWGFLDIFLSINLLRKRHWAYLVSLVLISIFVFYEAYRFSITHSLILLSVIFFDILIIWLIYKEYKKI